MTDREAQKTQYKYDAVRQTHKQSNVQLNLQMSNLVLQGQGNRGGENDPSGEGETLVGKRMAPFGDLAQRIKPVKQNKEKQEKQKDKNKAQKFQEIVDPSKNTKFDFNDELLYRPKTKDTKQVYEQMLSIVQKHTGDISLKDIEGYLDEVIAILKSDEFKDSERKKQIESFLDKMSEDTFHQFTILAQQLVDYTPSEEYMGERQEDLIDVNVEFDDEIGDDEIDEDQINDDNDMEYGQEGTPKHDIDEDEDEVQIDTHQEQRKTKQVDRDEALRKQQGLLDIIEIDAHWMKRKLGEFIKDKMPEELLEIEQLVLSYLRTDNARECDSKLAQLFSYQYPELNKVLVKNRFSLYYAIKIQQSQNQQDKDEIYKEMDSHNEGRQVLYQLEAQGSIKQGKNLLDEASQVTKKYQQLSATEMKDMLSKTVTDDILGQKATKQNMLDLETLQFNQGARLMANKKCTLPKGSTRITKKGYEEVYVPAVKHKLKAEDVLIPISDLPEWARPAFPPPIQTLNQIQSRLYKAAFKTPENLLVCAPTGAGKTNIALLAIMQILNDKRKSNGKFDIRNFKIVYIAPMKALVTEIVGNFQRRLEVFGLTVRELTGDIHLTKSQIDETQVIVTTPEKWDIITRKSGDRAYIDLVKLIIIDEIHLLHDLRGPVLEAIVARTIRQIETTSELVRIVALSATLPNYEDVAAFLRVKPESGLFFFDNSFRPVPLEQIYVGITEKKSIKKLMLMNEVCYDKVIERAGKYQILVFTHSRKETARTAKIIRDMALAKDELHKFLKDDSMSKEILQRESETAKSQDIRDLIPYGIGIHHAGLQRKDRNLVEQLFSAGHLQVLVSTATLAWGVNLPAHTVIIKGTQIYSPEKGKWVELSPQDMLQMMGRAGRPQFDKLGEGIIITNHSELQYYLSLNNQQLPIESQLISHLADQLNAEIVLGTVSNTKEAVNWLAYTYLYVRMLRSPELYGISQAEIERDPLLVQRRADLVHTAAILLTKASMIKYEKRTGALSTTALGKIASHYYIKHDSMSIYNDNLKPYMNIIDVLRLFALSKEFQFIPIRDNEKIELQRFIDKVPIPVKGSLDETATKINILLQAYISRFKMDGYDLNADMVYVTQSAGRIIRSLFEICAKRGWAQLSEVLLNLCKMVERRMWSSMTPLRQYHGIPEDILRKIEKKEQFTWQHFYDMSAQQIGEIVKFPKMGKVIHRLVHQFPRLELEAYVQPLTRTIIKVELAITPDFQWESKIHGRAEPFWVFVQDSDSEAILHSEQFILKDKFASEQHVITFTVPLHEPMPPQYFIKVISDRWLQCESILPVSFKHLILPERFSAPMELLDKPLTHVRELNFQPAEDLYISEKIKEFNPIITQAFNKLYQTDESIFIGAPNGSGLQTCAELAIFKQIQNEDYKQTDKIVYIAPVESLCKMKYNNWKQRLGTIIGLEIVMLTGNLQHDLELMRKADIIMSTPDRWDFISRKWKQRKIVQNVTLYIFDEIHLLPESGAIYEVICSRVRYMQNEIDQVIRIVALSTSLANAKDVSNWLGIPFPQNTFNFHPSVRPTPLEIHIQGFDHNNKATRVLAMERPAYNALKKNLHSKLDSQAIVFVSDRKQARLTSLDFITFATSDEDPKRFLSIKPDSDEEVKYLKQVKSAISEETLKSTLEYGVGFLHDGLTDKETQFIKDLFIKGIIRVIVVTYNLSWEIGDLECHIVIILDADKYDGHEHRYVEYSIPDMLQMMGRANLSQTSSSSRGSGPTLASKCFLYCHTPKKDYFIKFLQEPLPIESHLDHFLHDHLNADIVAGTVENKQDAVDWITWTFMYRRISQNPNYYNLAGKTGQHINDHLSELIENTVEELQKAKCITVQENEMDLEPANLGRIAAFYYIKYQTIEQFSKNLEDESILAKKLKYLIEVLSQAAEFENIPIRQGEDALLKSLETYLTYRIEASTPEEQVNYNEPQNKTNLLLQCHFSRRPLNIDLRTDQKFVLEKSIKLIHAMVDVISSHGYLKPALLCMELSQQVVQAMWVNQSPLLQLPYIDKDTVELLKTKSNVNDIVDFLNMDDEDRTKLLQLSESQMDNLASVCNRYPSLEISYETDKTTYNDGDVAELQVRVSRADVEDEDDLKVFTKPVFAQYYPGEKEEQWWVVVGQIKQNKLLSIKKITNFKNQKEVISKLNFVVNQAEGHDNVQYKIYLICDSYVGCDQAEVLKIHFEK